MSLFESFSGLVPWWLRSGDGGSVLASLSLWADDFMARARLGILARFPDYAPDDAALAAIGRDRRIVRGINEPAASYAARLIRAIDDHKQRGNPYALLRQIRAYLQADCVVRTVDRRGNWYSIAADGTESSSIDTGNWDWDGTPASPQWARFWLVIFPAGGTDPWATSGLIGGGALWGNGLVGGHPTKTIGTTATVDQVAAVKSIVRDWKPAGTVCEWVIIAFDDTTFTPAGATMPAGAWGNWSDGAGSPVRLSTARYWHIGRGAT